MSITEEIFNRYYMFSHYLNKDKTMSMGNFKRLFIITSLPCKVSFFYYTMKIGVLIILVQWSYDKIYVHHPNHMIDCIMIEVELEVDFQVEPMHILNRNVTLL